MKKRNLKQVILPLIAAMIWGSAFVAQSLSVEHIGSFTFNAARSWVGALVLLLLCVIVRKFKPQEAKTSEEKKAARRELLKGGLVCGLFLTLGSNLQQFGMHYGTNAGKAGFITALYIVLVPIFSIAFGKKANKRLLFCVVIAVFGLYFLSIVPSSDNGLQLGDVFVFFCAFAFSAQILSVDHFVQKVSGIELSCAQFTVTAVISTVCALLFEEINTSELAVCAPYILYVGIFSSGVAYTLQILAQKDGDPAVVSLLLSLESFFAVVSGAIILHEKLSSREYLGCALMLAAVCLSQLPEKVQKSNESAENSRSKQSDLS